MSGARKRYRIIDQERLLCLLSVEDMESFRHWHEAAIAEQCALAEIPKEPHWSRAFAVGSRTWLEDIVKTVPRAADYITPTGRDPNVDDTCVLDPPQSLCRRLWDSLAGGR
ncbi:MAG: hypothetical protein KAI66_23975 [Lentisphaeria bacterium]|nr:hypothetical protein [Lentisphaeria bacterium]